ncbi:MAG TPA: sensor histidine kinase [Gaiellaceae bacterium]|nr:sensor histidine kinase [Gaiellaceae bacterium]
MTALRLVLAAAGIALGVLAYRVQIDNLGPLTSSTQALAIVAVGWAFLGAGLIAWARRPGNRLGPLLTAAGFALLARQFRYSHDPLAFTVFFTLSELSYGLAAHSVLAYPSGHVRGRAEQLLVRVGYASVLVFPLAILLVYDGTERLRFMDPRPHENLLLVWENGSLAVTLQRIFVVWVWGVLASIFIALVLRRLVRATPRARRLLAPLCLAAVVFALRAVYEGIFAFVDRPSAVVDDVLFWWQIAGFMALPIALVAGMLRARLARANVGELVLELERTPPEGVRDALARALADPALEVGFWLPERLEYVDGRGRPLVLPGEDDDRAVTHLDHDGEPVAVIVHDASLVDEPELLLASGAAARLALENARLHADMRAQLLEVQESRVRIVQAADEERRRIERDLHDGAQQRLVALALQLRSAQRELGHTADPEVDRLLAEAVDELQVAVEELRELARGVHPAILTEDGLAAALESLTSRAPIPVALDVSEGRLPAQVEATAYFVACEALANVVKHAQASKATVSAHRRNGVLIVEVEDDGVGGAHAENGSGLRGLADRVEALGGRFVVESPTGGGTHVVGEIPCGS